MITIQQFDVKQFNNIEKVSFRIADTTFHVDQHYGDRILYSSPVYKYNSNVEETRLELWAEIQKYLPKYKAGEIQLFGKVTGYYFTYLMQLAEAYKKHKFVTLVYVSDRPHAELIKRCILWLTTQI